jgi:hypothetical protein
MLPALIMLVHDTDITKNDTIMSMLKEAAKEPMPGPAGKTGAGPAVSGAGFPDIGVKFLEKVTDFQKNLDATKTTLTDESQKAFTAARMGLTEIDSKMKNALTKGEVDFDSKLRGDLEKVGKHATELSGTLQPAIDAARKAAEEGDPGGLKRLADAYEKWLTGEGFKVLMNQIAIQFKNTPEIPAAVVGTGTPDPVRATVEIKELVIDLKPSPGLKSPPPAKGKPISLGSESFIQGYDEDRERGALVGKTGQRLG